MPSSATTDCPCARARFAAFVVANAAGVLATFACTGDSGNRQGPPPRVDACELGTVRCGTELERCEDGARGTRYVELENCTDQGLVCAGVLAACAVCLPGQSSCDDGAVFRCSDDGAEKELIETCDEGSGEACREGTCVNLCVQAAQHRSNIGCEYWAVDLDNARVDDTLNAAAQQFAVVVSNIQSDVTAEVTIEQDDTAPGDEGEPFAIAEAVIPPRSLRVFRLGPREVDGSPEGEFNTGTHSALTRAAYRVRSTFPVVAYQFNPLANVGVFSNDASLLKPFEAVVPEGDGVVDQYIVLGWPQTIASTDDPRTNFSSTDPVDLRAFLTVVGTRPGTTVRVSPTTRTLGAPGIDEAGPGDHVEVTLDAFDVLNLETDDFNADLTGTVVAADGPVIVFSGGEASDAPYFETLSSRFCCADHLEEQLDHLRTAGRSFVAAVTPSRTRALAAAGAAIGIAEQSEYFRVLATTDAGARISTSLASPSELRLEGRGDYADIASTRSFVLESDAPVMLTSVSPSQEAGGVPRGLPGGDPSLLVVPPIQQFRQSYVFLTPDLYAFDFVRILAPEDALIAFDGRALDDLGCETVAAGPSSAPLGRPTTYVVHTCQLGFPVVDPNLAAPDNLMSGSQNDGVHIIEANQKIGVLVDGFDAFVSYSYAAGTELEFIVER